jgi:oligopeptide/dipeptide ABC transporter ATP-binding protein
VTPLLDVRDLRISVPVGLDGRATAVDGVSFSVARGELLALVGESGCGKSLTSLALLRLLPQGARLEPGSSIRLAGEEITTLPEPAMRALRGKRIGMIFQDPMTALTPVLRVGDQLIETLRAHAPLSRQAARARAAALLSDVGIGDAERRLDAYPHELSGGLRQRVLIAIALAGDPDVLVADEPTTALDVTVQAQILELLDRLRRERGLAVLLVTHDLGVVAGRADRVAVMYAGQIVETATTAALFAAPQHPYTRGLLACVPRVDGPRTRLVPIPGLVPAPGTYPVGCRFQNRCGDAFDACTAAPSLTGAAHQCRCWLASAPLEPTA